MGNAEADLSQLRGRLPPLGEESDMCTQGFRRGGSGSNASTGRPTQRGKPQRWWDVLINWRSVRIRPGRLGWREVRCTGEAG